MLEKKDPEMQATCQMYQEKNEKIDSAPMGTNSVQTSFSKQVNFLLKNKLKSTSFLLQLRSLYCEIRAAAHGVINTYESPSQVWISGKWSIGRGNYCYT